jgi:hypothetical protein
VLAETEENEAAIERNVEVCIVIVSLSVLDVFQFEMGGVRFLIRNMHTSPGGRKTRTKIKKDR